MLLEFFGQAFGNQLYGQSGGVGGEDGPGLPELRNFPEQIAFDFKILGDDFDDPIGIGDAWKIVLKIADGDPRSKGRAEKRRRLGFFRGVDPGEHQFVALALCGVFRHDIEQQAVEAGVREVSRNARAHGARAKHSRFLYARSHKIALWNENETAEQVTKPASAGQTGVW